MWTETTARAAVRFAAGRATAGLVAPAAIGWAEGVLSTMFLNVLKTVALNDHRPHTRLGRSLRNRTLG